MNRIVLLFLGLTLSFPSCSQQNSSVDNVLSATEFSIKLNAITEKQVIDVRTPEEFNSGHLKNAKNINFYDEDFAKQLEALDKSKPVFVYCKSGRRSGLASTQMQQAGFKTVFDLQGGIIAWNKQNLPKE